MEKKGSFSGNRGGRVSEFFTIYWPIASKDHMLVPVAFGRFFAKPLPKKVTVRSRCGHTWTMALRETTDGNRVVLWNGWKKIAKDAHLRGYELLMFKYDGSQGFKVKIFNPSACVRGRISGKSKEMEDDDEVQEQVQEEEDDDDDYDDEVQEQVQEEDDDDDDDYDDDDSDSDDEEEDDDSNDVVVISEDDDSGEQAESDTIIDVGNTMRKKTREGRIKTKNQKEKRTSSCRGRSYLKKEDENLLKYLDNPMNPSFVTGQKRKRTTELHIPASIIRDYDLKLPHFIVFIDSMGKSKGEVKKWKSKQVVVKGFNKVIRRNKVKETDKVICEIECDKKGLVRAIKIHVVRK